MDRVSISAQSMLAQALALRSLCGDEVPCVFPDIKDALQKIIEVAELYVFVMPGTDEFYKPVTGHLDQLVKRSTSQTCRIFPGAITVDEPVPCPFLPILPAPLETKHVLHSIAVHLGIATLADTALNTFRLTIIELAKLQVERDSAPSGVEKKEVDKLAQDTTRLGKAAHNIYALVSKFERPLEKLAVCLHDMLLRAVSKRVNNIYGSEYMHVHVCRQGRRIQQSLFRLADDLLETVVADMEQKEAVEHTFRVQKLRQLQMNVGQLGDLLRSLPSSSSPSCEEKNNPEWGANGRQ